MQGFFNGKVTYTRLWLLIGHCKTLAFSTCFESDVRITSNSELKALFGQNMEKLKIFKTCAGFSIFTETCSYYINNTTFLTKAWSKRNTRSDTILSSDHGQQTLDHLVFPCYTLYNSKELPLFSEVFLKTLNHASWLTYFSILNLLMFSLSHMVSGSWWIFVSHCWQVPISRCSAFSSFSKRRSLTPCVVCSLYIFPSIEWHQSEMTIHQLV